MVVTEYTVVLGKERVLVLADFYEITKLGVKFYKKQGCVSGWPVVAFFVNYDGILKGKTNEE